MKSIKLAGSGKLKIDYDRKLISIDINDFELYLRNNLTKEFHGNDDTHCPIHDYLEELGIESTIGLEIAVINSIEFTLDNWVQSYILEISLINEIDGEQALDTLLYTKRYL